ncbi:MAG TPA: glycosyltransferase family 4 protein [Thermoanaerobaculia bacterium]|nr:glycosyltransferase family 4 protein [Thermoanaerobaculia bacterium]
MSRILYLCGDRGIDLEKRNGATAHFRSLVRAFTSLGHEVLVATPSAADATSLGAPVARIDTAWTLGELLTDVDSPVPRERREEQRRRKRVVHALGHVWNNLAVEEVLRRQIPSFRPDLVFELYSPFGVAGAVVCNQLGIPHLLNVHAPLAWEGAVFRNQALQEAADELEQTVLAKAQRIVTNSQEMRQILIAAGVDADKVAVVANGVDLELFTPEGAVARAGPDDAFVVGFSGSLKGWHGVDVLASAFRELAADSRFHLHVVGDGPERKRIQQLAEELPGRVTHTGAIDLEEVPPHLRGMDVAVAPYPPLEPFYFSPLKVLDAMACGTPNVASAIGQIRELLCDGETGLLAPPGDAPALASAIRRLADDGELRRRIAARALAEARSHHAWTSRAAELVSLGTEG